MKRPSITKVVRYIVEHEDSVTTVDFFPSSSEGHTHNVVINGEQFARLAEGIPPSARTAEHFTARFLEHNKG